MQREFNVLLKSDNNVENLKFPSVHAPEEMFLNYFRLNKIMSLRGKHNFFKDISLTMIKRGVFQYILSCGLDFRDIVNG